MNENEFARSLADALAPLLQYLTDNIDVLARGVAAYDDWGINRLEALANGYIDEDWCA